MDETDKHEFQLGSTTEEYGGVAIEPATVVVDDTTQRYINDDEVEIANESDDSDFVIHIDEGEQLNGSEPLETNNVSNVSDTADGDDDFCIVYEKLTPAPEVQIIENYHQYPPSISKKNRIRHSQNQPTNFITLENNSQESEENNIVQVSSSDPDSLDDSVCIIDEVYRVKDYGINQKSLLDSSEKKKRKIECGVCFDGPDEIATNGRNLVSTVCGHIFCNECVKMSLKATKQCPQCRKRLTAKQYHPIYI